MSTIVQKFGGTSVADPERICHVADRVAASRRNGAALVVAVSAMAGETDRLLALARQVSPVAGERERDVLVASGEQVSAALLALALQARGVPAHSLLGHQVRISTDSAFGRARIRHIEKDRLTAVLAEGGVAVVAGFQGVDGNGNITTLGRGGSDTTAVALAAALDAELCEIYTDVDGVYTADPRVAPDARKLERVTYDEMLELASLGAKVLQIRSVQFAKRYGIPLHVRSSFHDGPGTMVVREEKAMEDILVSGVAHDLDQAKITLRRVPDQPGLAATVFGPIAAAGIVVDMIIQNASADDVSGGDARYTDLTFTVPKGDRERALELVRTSGADAGAGGVESDPDVAKVSIVGLGMRSHAGVAQRMFEALAREGINIQMISTSEIKISVVVESAAAERAVRALHEELVVAKDGAVPHG